MMKSVTEFFDGPPAWKFSRTPDPNPQPYRGPSLPSIAAADSRCLCHLCRSPMYSRRALANMVEMHRAGHPHGDIAALFGGTAENVREAFKREGVDS